MKRNTKEVRIGKIVIMLVFIVFLLVFFTYMVLIYNNKRNARKTCEVMLNQMCSILDKNQSAQDTLLESLKEEYTIRAKTVAYMLEHHPEAEYDVEELCKIAELMSIDEIHLFDETGTIYSGTLPDYYGYSLDSGEQIAYFKPMLEDKSLSMCQDVMPNTAESKSMMYAITWDSTGEKMVQVGIEPTRLLAELKNNRISNVVDSMPAYKDLDIYVADVNTGEILGATEHQQGIRLSDIGIDFSNMDLNTSHYYSAVINGQKSECVVLKYKQYIICVVQNTKDIRKDTLISMLLVIAYLLIAAAALLLVIKRMLIFKREQMEQLSILTTMSEIYYSMHILDLPNNEVIEYYAQNQVKEVVAKSGGVNATAAMREIMHATMSDEYLERGMEFTDLSTLAGRLKGKKAIFMDLLGRNVGWIRMSFITISVDMDGNPQKVICTTQIIDEEKRKEEYLIRESITDKLTQCYNRRAYENDLQVHPDIPLEEDFVFVSMDVNGLKTVNDTLGHAAGDELLSGAAECMRRCLGNSGRVYRMGGDEFAAIIYANEDRLKEMKADLEETIDSWSGELVNKISVSCGYVTKKEFPDMTVAEMAKIADDRMYEAKARYYEECGIKRRIH